jgi:hypothetical protein
VVAVIVCCRRRRGGRTFASVLKVELQRAAVLLPVAGVLLVTEEWSQRTGLITFALVPVRPRVLDASSRRASSSPSRPSSWASPSSPRACSSRRQASRR